MNYVGGVRRIPRTDDKNTEIIFPLGGDYGMGIAITIGHCDQGALTGHNCGINHGREDFEREGGKGGERNYRKFTMGKGQKPEQGKHVKGDCLDA
jgi:hypothetical protein